MVVDLGTEGLIVPSYPSSKDNTPLGAETVNLPDHIFIVDHTKVKYRGGHFYIYLTKVRKKLFNNVRNVTEHTNMVMITRIE